MGDLAWCQLVERFMAERRLDADVWRERLRGTPSYGIARGQFLSHASERYCLGLLECAVNEAGTAEEA